MKKLTKVASVMLCGAVVSACSLAFLPTLHAAADVSEGQISPLSAVTPPNPSVETKQFNGMVRYRYTAEQCRYFWLSDTTAFTDGIYLDMQGTGYAVYKEAKIPIAGRYTESSYRFAKSRYIDSYGDAWDSNIVSAYRSEQTRSSVFDSLTTGTIKTYWKTFAVDVGLFDNVYVTVAYAGECVDSNFYQVRSIYTNNPVTILAGGVAFSFEIKVGEIKIKANKDVTLDEVSTNKNWCASVAFSWYVP